MSKIKNPLASKHVPCLRRVQTRLKPNVDRRTSPGPIILSQAQPPALQKKRRAMVYSSRLPSTPDTTPPLTLKTCS